MQHPKEARLPLPKEARLPPGHDLVPRAGDEEAERQRLIAQCVHKLRSDRQLAEEYRAGLEKKTVAELREHVSAVRAARKERRVKDLAHVIFVVIFSACVLYSVYYHRNLEVVVGPTGETLAFSNVRVNDRGLVAMFDGDGKRLTPWERRILDPNTGAYVEATKYDPRTKKWGIRFTGPRRAISLGYTVDPEWRLNSPKVLPIVFSYGRLPDTMLGLSTWFCVDRRFLPKSSVLDPVFKIDFGLGAPQDTVVWPLNSDGTRFLVHAYYVYPQEGEYDVELEYLTHYESVKREGGNTHAERPQAFTKRVARFRISKDAPPKLLQIKPPKPPEQQFTRAFRFLANKDTGYTPSQVMLTQASANDSTTLLVAIVPGTRWPKMAELPGSAFGIGFGNNQWLTKDQLQAAPVNQGAGPDQAYAISFGRQFTEGVHSIELWGKTADGRELPTFKFQIRVSPTDPPEIIAPKQAIREYSDDVARVQLAEFR